LAAAHFLLGASNLLVLALPDGWQLATGRGQPEVDATLVQGDYRWARQGRAWYYLWPAGGRPRLDLTVHIGEAAAGPDDVTDRGTFSAGGHAGRWLLGRRRQPWLGRTSWPLLTADLACPVTDRQLALELAGPARWPDLGPLLEFAAVLEGLECH